MSSALRVRGPVRGPGPGSDAGETLIELLVTIAVMGVAFVAVLGSVAAAIDVSTMHRQQAQARAYLRQWAESVTRATETGYVACPTGPSSSLTAPSGAPQGITPLASPAVYVWTGTGFIPCSSATSSQDEGIQRITLAVSADPGLLPSFTQTVFVVVRKP